MWNAQHTIGCNGSIHFGADPSNTRWVNGLSGGSINSIQIYRFFSLPHFISLLHALVRWNKKCAAEYGASLLVILTFSSSEWAKEHADRWRDTVRIERNPLVIHSNRNKITKTTYFYASALTFVDCERFQTQRHYDSAFLYRKLWDDTRIVRPDSHSQTYTLCSFSAPNKHHSSHSAIRNIACPHSRQEARLPSRLWGTFQHWVVEYTDSTPCSKAGSTIRIRDNNQLQLSRCRMDRTLHSHKSYSVDWQRPKPLLFALVFQHPMIWGNTLIFHRCSHSKKYTLHTDAFQSIFGSIPMDKFHTKSLNRSHKSRCWLLGCDIVPAAEDTDSTQHPKADNRTLNPCNMCIAEHFHSSNPSLSSMLVRPRSRK